jgi:transposase-like protein
MSIEERIPASPPMRRIRKLLADQALDRLNPTFCKLQAAVGRLRWVHFLRNLLSHLPKAGQDMVAAVIWGCS